MRMLENRLLPAFSAIQCFLTPINSDNYTDLSPFACKYTSLGQRNNKFTRKNSNIFVYYNMNNSGLANYICLANEEQLKYMYLVMAFCQKLRV